MNAFFRFPHTPHLLWLGEGQPRDDKVLGPAEVEDLLSKQVVVEEKVDGANLGFSVDESGTLRAQNRGSYVDLDAPQGQWKPLKRWLGRRRQALTDALAEDLILFGEWCYAVHSVRYTRLPDWFLAFDVFDRERREFWSVARRNELIRRLDLAMIPFVAKGRFDLARLKNLLGPSQLSDGSAEGIYVRQERNGRLVARAKLVRPEFAQSIGEHWSRRTIQTNLLAGGAERHALGTGSR